MDIQTGLEYLSANGGLDGVKAVAFAMVDANNLAETEAALAIFGSILAAAIPPKSGSFEIDFIIWAAATEFTASFWNGWQQENRWSRKHGWSSGPSISGPGSSSRGSTWPSCKLLSAELGVEPSGLIRNLVRDGMLPA
jgi:hypothetical protein